MASKPKKKKQTALEADLEGYDKAALAELDNAPEGGIAPETAPDAPQEIEPIANAPEDDKPEGGIEEGILPLENAASDVPAPDGGWKWPASTERVDLRVAFTDHTKALKADELSKGFKAIQAKKLQLKNHTSAVKAQIEDMMENMTSLADEVQRGGTIEKVECEWQFETSGRDKEGSFVFHPEMKSLVNPLTGKVVRIARIEPADRQACFDLPLDQQEQPEAQEGQETDTTTPPGDPDPGTSDENTADPEANPAEGAGDEDQDA